MSNFQYIGLLLVQKSGGLCGCANPINQRHFLKVLHVRKMATATLNEVKPPDFDYQLIRSLKPFPLWLQQGKVSCNVNTPLFVFSIGGPKQNVKSFLTPVSESVLYALSRGSLGFAFHGSFFNHFLIGWFSSTANKNLWNRRLIRLPWRTKCRLPCERAWKTVPETRVKSDFTFCLRPPIEKTNSAVVLPTLSLSSSIFVCSPLHWNVNKVVTK